MNNLGVGVRFSCRFVRLVTFPKDQLHIILFLTSHWHYGESLMVLVLRTNELYAIKWHCRDENRATFNIFCHSFGSYSEVSSYIIQISTASVLSTYWQSFKITLHIILKWINSKFERFSMHSLFSHNGCSNVIKK